MGEFHIVRAHSVHKAELRNINGTKKNSDDAGTKRMNEEAQRMDFIHRKHTVVYLTLSCAVERPCLPA